MATVLTRPARFVPSMPPCHAPCGRTGVVTEGGLCTRCRRADDVAEKRRQEAERD